MTRVTGTLLVLLLVPEYSLSAPARNSWDNLKALAPGDEVTVALNDAKSYGGLFRGVSEEVITVRLATGEQTFERKNILRVSAMGRSHRLRNALIAGGTGCGMGLGIGAAYAHSEKHEYPENHYFEVYGSGLGVFLGGVGAGFGAWLSKPGWHDVYRAR